MLSVFEAQFFFLFILSFHALMLFTQEEKQSMMEYRNGKDDNDTSFSIA